MDWKLVREEFPALRDWIYLNTATMGQLPRRAEEAAARHFAHRNALACTDFLDWYDDADRLRGKLAQLFGGLAGDYAFFPAASPVLSLLVGGIDWQPGDRIVTLLDEFPNHVYHPLLLAERGVELVETDWVGFREAVEGARTRLVALSSMNYMTGFRPPLVETSRWLKERGVLFYVDGTQGAGALRYDLGAIDPDVFAVHGYKWMLAPAGAAFAYVSPRVREWLRPNVVGWRSHKDWRNVNALHHGRPEFAAEAERYEGYMLPALLLCMLEASVDLMLELGPEAIESRVLELSGFVRAAAIALGGRVVTDGESPILAIRFEGRDSASLTKDLKKNSIIVSSRHGNLRLSTHFYNSDDDVARFYSCMRMCLTA